MAKIERPAIGQIGDLGGLYNAARDRFLPSDVRVVALPTETIQSNPLDSTDILVRRQHTFKDRLDALNVGPDLSASVLAGFIGLNRSGRVLSDHDIALKTITSLFYTIHTVEEKLNFQAPQFKAYFESQLNANPNATHLIIGIEWGAVNVISFHTTRSLNSLNDTDREDLHDRVAQWATTLKKHSNDGYINHSASLHNQIKNLGISITIHSDILPGKPILVSSVQEAEDFLQIAHLEIRDQNDRRGQPISYSLLPVDMARMFLLNQASTVPAAVPIPSALTDSFIDLFDEFQKCKQQGLQHSRYISEHKRFLPASSIDDVQQRVLRMETSRQCFLDSFAKTLKSVRDQKDTIDKLAILLQEFEGKRSPKELSQIDDFGLEALTFLGNAVSEGATYLGHNTPMLETQLKRLQSEDTYLLSFSRAFIKEQVWSDAQDLFWRMMSEKKSSKMVILDCDAVSKPLESPLISHYKNGSEVIHDLLDQELFNAQNCVAKCDLQWLETDKVEKPARRRFVKIPCPGASCSDHQSLEWKCQRCMDPLEFGFVDDYIYCQCGKADYKTFEFKCNQSSHGPHLADYEPNKLLRLLKTLDSSNYINILILGETGVGKSTFINALVNYLEFSSLDNAIASDPLLWVIPSSFSLQTMNRDDPNGHIEEQKIKVGDRSDEADSSKGESATQQTAVYPVTFQNDKGTFTVRLIDTPGIGDTRGVEYDKKNMADILQTLKSYDELHGILILLKSNAARLTITFQYCVKELLTHLHHSAAKNMVFGFTNTRISNYTPGDTFTPLKELLSQNRDVGLTLSNHTTYCFDSESFRYLAAFKNNVSMPNKQDFDRSWTQSRAETTRLMDHFQSIAPHQTQSTLSLNGTRELIKSLTKPMADISLSIKRNIQVVEDEVKDVEQTRLTGDQLRSKLRIKKIQMSAVQLAKPRTVCTHTSCTETRDNGKTGGLHEMVVIYKTHCHKECYLDNVSVDIFPEPLLISCAAFNGNNECSNCGHNWQQHMHIIYELEAETVEVNDPGVQQQIQNNASSIQLKQTAIRGKNLTIKEYKEELDQIHAAAAKFGIFLKKNSITPYNDATRAYLEFLIKEERGKVEAGGSRKRLDSLEEDLRMHEEAVRILDSSMTKNSNPPNLTLQAIELEIKKLYNLKHFGKDLQNLRSSIAQAHDATNRERPHRSRRHHNVPRKIEYRLKALPQVPQGFVGRRPSGRSAHNNHYNIHSGGRQNDGYGTPSLSNMGNSVINGMSNLFWGNGSSSSKGPRYS